MKKGIIIVIIVIVIIVGFFFFSDSQEEVVESPTTTAPSEPRSPGVRVIGADEVQDQNNNQEAEQ